MVEEQTRNRQLEQKARLNTQRRLLVQLKRLYFGKDGSVKAKRDKKATQKTSKAIKKLVLMNEKMVQNDAESKQVSSEV